MVCWATSQICECDEELQFEIGSAGGICPLTFLLGYDTNEDSSKTTKPVSIHTVVKLIITDRKGGSGGCREQLDEENVPRTGSNDSLSPVTPKPNVVQNGFQIISASLSSLENGKLLQQNSLLSSTIRTLRKQKQTLCCGSWPSSTTQKNSRRITGTHALLLWVIEKG
jgi:hypothetical protein